MFDIMTQTKRFLIGTGFLTTFAVLLATSSPALGQNVLFSEDFEGLTLGAGVDESVDDDPREAVYSPTGPEGWTIDRSGVPAGGVLEFQGWNFLDPSWWDETSGQNRADFVFAGEGVTAVADGDEWDDKAHEPGNMNTLLITPPVSVSPGEVDLQFDTSWRPDGTQEARVRAVFDVGEPSTLIHWFSSEEDAVTAGFDGPLSNDELFGHKTEFLPADERIDAVINVPAGASEVSIEFGYLDAGNNWWWAVDNIDIDDGAFFEDFEDVELGPNLDRGRAPAEFVGEDATVWTNTPPEGWSIDASGVPGVDAEFPDPTNDGVTEWAGWSFANKEWWTLVAGDQSRSSFESGEGAVLIADPDEWDDAGHPASAENDWYQTTIDTPEISLEGVAAGDEVSIEFDSSWRPEFDDNFRQSGRLVAKFSDGTEAEIFEWNSAEGNNTEEFLAGSTEVAATYANGDKLNDEDLTFPVPVPDGATSVSFQFEMFDAGNDWWWALDNIRLLSSGESLPVCPLGDIDGDCAVQFSDFLILSNNFGTDVAANSNGDLDGDGSVGFADFLILSDNFGATAPATSVPEPTGFALGMLSMLGLMVRRRRGA